MQHVKNKLLLNMIEEALNASDCHNGNTFNSGLSIFAFSSFLES